ncbi:MAG: hypothetical protein LUI87_17020, partial [Lachnospiraceae bacterium]|nr:hypothetical protein [Lachnospiraceae bacterium]
MGKKNFSNADGNKNSRNSGSGGFGQLLAGMGFQVEEKKEEPVQNKYAGYDSDKEARQGRKQGQGRQDGGSYSQQGQGRQGSGSYGQQGQGRQGSGSYRQQRQVRQGGGSLIHQSERRHGR